MKFRKKPVVIEATQFDGEYLLPGMSMGGAEPYGYERAGVQTLEGFMVAKRGDWIIRGIKGEFYPIKDEIFRETYEIVME